MAGPSQEKGLANYAGANNCFLNVVIQSLWHLDSFRRRFFGWNESHHTHQAAHSCVFCALSVVFTQYAYSEESFIPPDALRVALHLIYRDSRRFQVGDLDDAAEALDAILQCLEKSMAATRRELEAKKAAALRHLPHIAFGLTITEQIQCKGCRAASAPFTSSSYIFYSYAASLVRFHKNYPLLSFGQLLNAVADDQLKSCPNEAACSLKCGVYRHLMTQPDIFTLDLVWESPNPDAADIANVTNLIPIDLDLNEVFPSVGAKAPYVLRGMICYYGLHYNAYFYSYSKQQWLVYDDSRVIPAGRTWPVIQERLCRGRFQASVLFYETLAPTRTLPPPDLWRPTVTEPTPAEDDQAPPPYAAAEPPPSYESSSPSRSSSSSPSPPSYQQLAAPPPDYASLLASAPPSTPPHAAGSIAGHMRPVIRQTSPSFSAFRAPSTVARATASLPTSPPPVYTAPTTTPTTSFVPSPSPPAVLQPSPTTLHPPAAVLQPSPTTLHPPAAALQPSAFSHVPLSSPPAFSHGAPPVIAPLGTLPLRPSPAPAYVQPTAAYVQPAPVRSPPVLPTTVKPTFAAPLAPPMDPSEFARLFPAPKPATLHNETLLDELDGSQWNTIDKLMQGNPNYAESLVSPLPAVRSSAAAAPFSSSVLNSAHAMTLPPSELTFLPLDRYRELGAFRPSAPPL